MKKTLLSLTLLALTAYNADAQNILGELRKDVPGQGHITVNQSNDIEQLIVLPKSEKPAAAAPATTTPKAPEQHEAPATAGKPSTPKPYVPEAEETVNDSKKIMRRSYKAQGYRIQVYSGGNKRSDREKCEEIARRLKASIPGLPVYVHFYSPSWKCRAGNFTSIEEARKVLTQVKGMGYSQACLIKGTINVAY